MMVRITGVLALACLLVLGVAGTAAADGHLAQLDASLAGANEVGPGAPGGVGAASVTIDPGTYEVCYTITTSNIEAPTAAHIHSGGAGSNGDVVVNFDYATNGGEGCVTSSEAVVNGIMLNPSLYYVNVHNADFPGGAIRGQLALTSSPAAPAPAADAAPPAAPAAEAQELAFTGSSLTAILAIAGSAAVATGALMVGAERRNR